MTDSLYDRLGRISGLSGIAVPVCLFFALRWLRAPRNTFQEVSILCGSSEDCHRKLAELNRAHSVAQSELIYRTHADMIALTLLALTFLLLCFLFTRNGVSKWTKYLLTASVVASIACCWLQW